MLSFTPFIPSGGAKLSAKVQPFVPKSYSNVPVVTNPTPAPVITTTTTSTTTALPPPKKKVAIIDPKTGLDIFGNKPDVSDKVEETKPENVETTAPVKVVEKIEEKVEKVEEKVEEKVVEKAIKVEKKVEDEEDSLDVEVEDSMDVEISDKDDEDEGEDDEDDEEDDDEEDEDYDDEEESSSEEEGDVKKKRVYSRDQLLKFKNLASDPPDVLKRSDIFVDGNKSTPTSEFKPSWSKQPGAKGQFPLQRGKKPQSGGKKSGGKGKRDKGPKLEKSVALKNKIESEKTISEIKFILNKLSENNYEAIKADLLAVDVKDDEVGAVINQIFETAINNAVFSGMYADLCADLSRTEGTIYGRTSNFKKILLNSCQIEFEKIPEARKQYLEAKEANTYSEVELLEISGKLKTRIIGNISFIGELFKKSMMSSPIMHEIIKELLLDSEHPEEDQVEILCSLLTNIGMNLDASESSREYMDTYFSKLEAIKAEKSTSSRIKFMILDLMDLRKSGFKKEVKTKTKQPAQQQQQSQQKQIYTNKDSGRDSDRYGKNKSKSQDVRKSNKYDKSDRNDRIARMERMELEKQNKKPAGRGYASPSSPSNSSEWEVKGNKKGSSGKSGSSSGKKQFTSNVVSGKKLPDIEIDSSNSFSALNDEENQSPVSPKVTIKKRPTSNATNNVNVVKEELLTKEEIETKTQSTFNSLIDGGEYEDSMDDLKDMKLSDYSTSVATLVEFVIEKKELERKLLVDLVLRCVRNDIYNESQLIKGINISIKKAIDTELYFDVPKYFDLIGEIVGRLAYEKVISANSFDKILNLEFLTSSQCVKTYASMLMTMKKEFELMNELTIKSAKQLSTSNFNILNVLGGKKMNFDALMKLVNQQNTFDMDPVLFIMNAIQTGKEIDKVQKWYLDNLKEQLEDSEQLISQIVSGLIFSIEMTSRFEKKSNLELEVELFTKYSPILKKCLEKEKFKKTAILEIQKFGHSTNYPTGLLSTLFELFLNENLISKEVFQFWFKDAKYGSQFDKDKAKAQVKEFMEKL